MADMEITVSRDEQHAMLNHVVLGGAINATSVIEFKQIMDQLIMENDRNFLIDFRDVSYINSTGMGIMVQYTDTCRNDGGNLALLNVHPKVKVAFDILGLDNYFEMIRDRDEGIEAALKTPITEDEKMLVEEEQVRTEAGEIRERRIRADNKFPQIVECQFCQLAIRIDGTGKFTCPACYTTITAEEGGGMLFECRTSAVPIKLSLPYSKLGFRSAMEFVTIFANQHGFDQVDLDKVTNSVAEILDLIEKGDPDRKQALFNLLCTSDSKALRFRFTDSGKSFDIKDRSFLAKTPYLMDKIQYKPNPKGGNILQVTKLLRKK
ncbi:anti-sigma factor antagonist [Planctomycetota bacterium]